MLGYISLIMHPNKDAEIQKKRTEIENKRKKRKIREKKYIKKNSGDRR